MESDPNVMRYTSGEAKDMAENTIDLNRCIHAYSDPENRFRIWAVEQKSTSKMVGTCALVASDEFELPKEYHDGAGQIDEIGYRFLQSEWRKGWGQEVCDGLIDHCIERLSATTLIAQVDALNVASVRILDRSKLIEIPEIKPANCGCDRVYIWQRHSN